MSSGRLKQLANYEDYLNVGIEAYSTWRYLEAVKSNTILGIGFASDKIDDR